MKFEFNWANGLWKNYVLIYSNKKETSDFYGTVSLEPAKISQQK